MAAGKKKPVEKTERKRSLLVQAGDEAKRKAMAALLLRTLKDQGWNLSRTARALDMGDASAVIRYIRETGLDAEYAAARERGDVSPGSPQD